MPLWPTFQNYGVGSFENLCRPVRPQWEGSLRALNETNTLEEAWETAAGRGLIPTDWSAREWRFYSGAQRVVQSASCPNTRGLLAALASDPSGIELAEKLRRESLQRERMWIRRAPEETSLDVPVWAVACIPGGEGWPKLYFPVPDDGLGPLIRGALMALIEKHVGPRLGLNFDELVDAGIAHFFGEEGEREWRSARTALDALLGDRTRRGSTDRSPSFMAGCKIREAIQLHIAYEQFSPLLAPETVLPNPFEPVVSLIALGYVLVDCIIDSQLERGVLVAPWPVG